MSLIIVSAAVAEDRKYCSWDDRPRTCELEHTIVHGNQRVNIHQFLSSRDRIQVDHDLEYYILSYEKLEREHFSQSLHVKSLNEKAKKRSIMLVLITVGSVLTGAAIGICVGFYGMK